MPNQKEDYDVIAEECQNAKKKSDKMFAIHNLPVWEPGFWRVRGTQKYQQDMQDRPVINYFCSKPYAPKPVKA
eukprot:JP439966.1.p3 GENE.JP439966.1~~JP439966.1.p3  ORF type:complete len:73 (-),score=22.58 JP439966.1:151-369(-)